MVSGNGRWIEGYAAPAMGTLTHLHHLMSLEGLAKKKQAGNMADEM